MRVLDQFKLAGKVALVAGASRGLGRGMALALGEAGANVSRSPAQNYLWRKPPGR